MATKQAKTRRATRARKATKNPAAVPVRFRASIGGSFGTSYVVELRPEGLWYNQCRNSEMACVEGFPRILKMPTLAAWRRFRAELDALDVWAWEEFYPNVALVYDGYGFGVEI